MPNPEDFLVKKIINNDEFIGDSNEADAGVSLIYVHVVKARGSGFLRHHRSPNPSVELKIGLVRKTTEPCSDISNPVWNRVYGFLEDDFSGSTILRVGIKQGTRLLGFCNIALPVAVVPSNCTVAPQWQRLFNKKNEPVDLELLLSVSEGYQGSHQWNLDARDRGATALPDIRSSLYITPRLYYLRVNVIEASLLIPHNALYRDPQFFVRVRLGKQTACTPTRSQLRNPIWNHDMMFVVAHPFADHLIITVEDMLERYPVESHFVGRAVLPLDDITRRSDDSAVDAISLNLLDTVHPQVVSKIFLRVCLEQGYHVYHDSATYSSDLRPSDLNISKPNLGVLDLGIIRAKGLLPMKTREGQQQTTDSYCVAKYRDRWFRTRTIQGSLNPTWNQAFRWNVSEPYTVVTIGVFDSCDAGAKDSVVGRVRIRLSSLRTGQVYTHSYPLLVIQPEGEKLLGELELSVRFTCSSWFKLVRSYSQPLLPRMNHILPLSPSDTDSLRLQAVDMVTMHLAQAEPPLKKEVVEYILNLDSLSWSVRRSTANLVRLLRPLVWLKKFIVDIRAWKSTPKTLLAAFCIFVFIFWSDTVLPFLPLILFFIGLLSYFWRSDLPPHIDLALSQTSTTRTLHLAQELDSYPSSYEADVISDSYDHLRRVCGTVQTNLGQVSGLVERFVLLLSWRDERATALFLVFSLLTGISLVLLWLASRYMYSRYMYYVPFSQVLQVIVTLYLLRPPRFRRRLELLPWVTNFFWRLPTRQDELF